MAGHDPRLIRFLVSHALVGGLAAIGLVSLIVIFNIAGLKALIMRSDVGILALAIMTTFFAITFASVQMGVALTMLAEPDDATPPSGRRARLAHALRSAFAPPRIVPVPVRPNR